MNNKYEDIINLDHYISLKHPRMSIEARAAQFAPFSALTGYEDAVRETARITDKRIEIDDGLKQIINDKLQYILENKDNVVTFTYFVPDSKKDGGKYIEKSGIVKKIDLIEQIVILKDNSRIPICEIINITSDIFKDND